MGNRESDFTKDIIAKAKKKEFSGVISIHRNGEKVLNQAFGLRNRAENLPNETGTRFGTASGTKLFTALGIGALLDRGAISLGSKVCEIDKTWRSFADEETTVQHLLSHTSGIFDYYDEEIETDFDNFFVAIPWNLLETPSDYLPLFTGKPKFKPGERFSYSNGGYVFLGVLIEKLTGELYRDFILENVLHPAGMGHSGFFALDDLPRNTALGYKEKGTTNIFNLPIRGGGDGGMFTTADDLRSFWANLFAGKILSREMTDHFMKTQWKFSETSGYGSGIYKELDDSMFSIVGGDAGVGFDSRYLVEEKITISILSNITDGENKMRQFILEGREKLCWG